MDSENAGKACGEEAWGVIPFPTKKPVKRRLITTEAMQTAIRRGAEYLVESADDGAMRILIVPAKSACSGAFASQAL